MLHLGQIRPGLDRGEPCGYVVRFGQAAVEWGQAENDGTTAVARRNSVHDPSVPLHESGGGRPPCGVFCCWMGLNQHAYFLLHTSGPEPTAGRQLRNIVYADHTSRCSGRTAAVLAPESSRNTIRCYTYALHSCLRATHALLLAVPCALRSHRLGSSCSRRHRRRSPFGSVVR